MDFQRDFGIYYPFLRDLGPFLRPDLGEKLGGCYQIQIYINQGFLNPKGASLEHIYAEYFPSQSHFYAGKPLRRAPLRAIYGSFVHPIQFRQFCWVLEIW